MRIFALALAVAAACRHAPVVEPVHDTDDDDVPDDVDRCPEVACAIDTGDDDGCPDPGPIVIHVPLDHDDRARLAAIARGPAANLIVTGRALPNEPTGLALERATAIALRLEEDGAALERLTARASPAVSLTDTMAVEIDCAATGSSASR